MQSFFWKRGKTCTVCWTALPFIGKSKKKSLKTSQSLTEGQQNFKPASNAKLSDVMCTSPQVNSCFKVSFLQRFSSKEATVEPRSWIVSSTKLSFFWKGKGQQLPVKNEQSFLNFCFELGAWDQQSGKWTPDLRLWVVQTWVFWKGKQEILTILWWILKNAWFCDENGIS